MRHQYMHYTMIISFCEAIVLTGEIWNSIAFCQRHPSVLPNMLSFSIASALGQVSYVSHCLLRNTVHKVYEKSRHIGLGLY